MHASRALDRRELLHDLPSRPVPKDAPAMLAAFQWLLPLVRPPSKITAESADLLFLCGIVPELLQLLQQHNIHLVFTPFHTMPPPEVVIFLHSHPNLLPPNSDGELHVLRNFDPVAS